MREFCWYSIIFLSDESLINHSFDNSKITAQSNVYKYTMKYEQWSHSQA
jgi:hypothetical protein